ncbi:MAG: DUF1801 domain-containing protein [Anaerolineae bacterium]|nr:DUF1801 domain-containing protein [Anaerolineae bacterium]
MNSSSKAPANVDEYIAAWSEDVQTRLTAMRKTIHEAAPEATKIISYGVPTFRLNNKNLVSFGAAKHHLGFYPTPSAIKAFGVQLSTYSAAKGSVQFPYDKPLPYDLIVEMVNFRVEEVSKKKK